MKDDKYLKQMQDEKFSWFSPAKKNGHTFSNEDISINMVTVDKKSGKKGFSLIFRNKCYEKLGKFVEIAIYKNRIFFRETNDNGLTIRGKKRSPENTHYASINYISEEVERLKDFIGDYELKHDEFYELYYIEKKEE